MVITRKKSRSIISLMLTCSFGLLPVSCIEDVVMDPEEDMPVVVKCVLTRGERNEYQLKAEIPVQTLELFYAKSPSEKTQRIISDAVVQVSGGGETYDFSWNGEKWSCAFLPDYDTDYTLSIVINNHETLSAKTRYPQLSYITSTSVYVGRTATSMAKYYTVSGEGQKDVFIWITAIDASDDIYRFCTNHPGADNSNIIGGIWEDLPIAKSILNDFNGIMENGFESPNRDYWVKYRSLCLGLPIHKDYLRICHPSDFNNGIAECLVQNTWSGDTQCPEGFVLAADRIQELYGPTWVGPMNWCLPVRAHFLSKEYDLYLSKIVERSSHKDELAEMYSSNYIYSNIEGGLGVFGAMDYYDYVY